MATDYNFGCRHTHKHTRTHAHTHARTHARTHTHTHTHTRERTQTRARTHQLPFSIMNELFVFILSRIELIYFTSNGRGRLCSNTVAKCDVKTGAEIVFCFLR